MSKFSRRHVDDLLRRLREPRRFIQVLWGHLTESAVGAHLVNAAAGGVCEVFYWRYRGREVDFVVRAGPVVTALEVESGRRREALPGLGAFADAFPPCRTLLVGAGGVPVEEFLAQPVERWVR